MARLPGGAHLALVPFVHRPFPGAARAAGPLTRERMDDHAIQVLWIPHRWRIRPLLVPRLHLDLVGHIRVRHVDSSHQPESQHHLRGERGASDSRTPLTG